jgi:TDG/mug DNA glycosylase family protein
MARQGLSSAPPYSRLRLRDIVGPDVGVLFVGINPGVRSAEVGHHFAGHSNGFWRLLHESGLVPERIGWEDDRRLLQWGFGITNLVARPTPGVSGLSRNELETGARRLARKVRRLRPAVVALVGVTVYRALFPATPAGRVAVGLRPDRVAGARVFVLPNPSGRNANFSRAEMLRAFRGLARHLRHRRRPRTSRR